MTRLTSIVHAAAIPISLPKTVDPATALEYLGIILDTVAMEAHLPRDKLECLKGLVWDFLDKTSCTNLQLLGLLGHMNFAARVVPPGRSFMSRIFWAAFSVKELFHRVSLSEDCRADLCMWSHLLERWNGVSLFLDSAPTDAGHLGLYTDVSGSLGFGAFFQGQWFYPAWCDHLPPTLAQSSSTAFKELFQSLSLPCCGGRTGLANGSYSILITWPPYTLSIKSLLGVL